MSTTTVHFSICPEWLTDLLRKLWLEKEYGKAFRIVESAFPQMSVEDKLFIVTGRKKLVYAPGSKTEFVLEGDNWAPSGAYKGMHVATFADVLDQSQLFTDNKEAFDLLREVSVMAWSANGIPSRKSFGWTKMKGSPKGWIDSRNVIELICRLFPVPTAEQWYAFWEKYGGEVDDIKQQDSLSVISDKVDEILNEEDAGSSLKGALGLQEQNDAKLAAQWGPSTATNMDVYLAHCRELDSRPTPDPDYSLEREDGWVLPDGKFYPCGYMEHIWLAGRLGKEEREAEAAGWVKISHGIDERLYIQHYGDREPTQKQINTVFDWCEKHKAKLPDWAGGKE